jgi:hypothetical protein
MASVLDTKCDVDERLEVSVTFDERHGYIASAPELRQPATALSLGGLRQAGLIHRRIDASPWAILYADAQAAHAEAAE